MPRIWLLQYHYQLTSHTVVVVTNSHRCNDYCKRHHTLLNRIYYIKYSIHSAQCCTRQRSKTAKITCNELHSAWSESSAARPRPRGGHGTGEKLGAWAFATLEMRGPQGRADEPCIFVASDLNYKHETHALACTAGS